MKNRRSGFSDRPPIVPADVAVRQIPLGSRIVSSPTCGAPTTLLASLGRNAAGRTWSLWSGLMLSHASVIDSITSGELGYTTWHPGSDVVPLVESGAVDYIPIRASRLMDLIPQWGLETALVRVTSPDRHGWCSLGPSVGYPLTALTHAKRRIAEIDPSWPRTWGQSMVHVSMFDALVESTEPMQLYRTIEPGAVSDAIARHVLDLLPDRPMLQLGIGAIPEALVGELHRCGVSGVRFTGMGCDGMVDLFEDELVDRGLTPLPPLSTPDLLGTEKLMRFADDNPAVGVYPSSISHSVIALAGNDRLVSINSAVAVDVTGQVNSEIMRERQISGIGGSMDFTEAAIHSPGGKRIVALPATAGKQGEISRIVARLGAESSVTIPKGQVQFVVTEHGVARLEGRTARQRAEDLIAIAAPQHRQRLSEEAFR